MVILSFPFSVPNNLWYISSAGIVISCEKVDDVSKDDLVSVFISSLSKYGQV